MDMPRRAASNGRHGSGSSRRSALNPMKQIRVSASVPPATATGATPSATRSAATASETAPELHAVTSVSRGPPSPRREPTTSACEYGRIERSSGVARSGTPLRLACQYQASASSIPPPKSEEHTSELQSRQYLVCRLLLEKKNND